MVCFHVLRCATCETFQVLQVTKTKKWKCKLCGQKQSIIKVYGEGTGAECRQHVQKLNTLRGVIDQQVDEKYAHGKSEPRYSKDVDFVIEAEDEINTAQNRGSRWSQYMDEPQEEQEIHQTNSSRTDGGDNMLFDQIITTDKSQYNKRKREYKAEYQQKKFQVSWHPGEAVKQKYTANTFNTACNQSAYKPCSTPSSSSPQPSSFNYSVAAQQPRSAHVRGAVLSMVDVNHDKKSVLSNKFNPPQKTTPMFNHSVRLSNMSGQGTEEASLICNTNTATICRASITEDHSDTEVQRGMIPNANSMNIYKQSGESCLTDQTVSKANRQTLHEGPERKTQSVVSSSSKWAAFIEEDEDDESSDGDADLNGVEFSL